MNQSPAHGFALSSPVNWLKGEVLVRAYLAQRDQFLELYRRAGFATGRGRRPEPAEGGQKETGPAGVSP